MAKSWMAHELELVPVEKTPPPPFRVWNIHPLPRASYQVIKVSGGKVSIRSDFQLWFSIEWDMGGGPAFKAQTCIMSRWHLAFRTLHWQTSWEHSSKTGLKTWREPMFFSTGSGCFAILALLGRLNWRHIRQLRWWRNNLKRSKMNISKAVKTCQDPLWIKKEKHVQKSS